MNNVFITIGSFDIKWYSVCIMVAVFLGIFLFSYEGKKFSFPKDFLFNLAFWTVIGGLLGARIYYVIFNFNLYVNNPIDIFKVWEGGLAIHGGLIFGAIVAYFYCKKYDAPIIKILDMLIPSLLIGQAIGRWGNFFNMEAHGGIVDKALLLKYHIPNFVIEGMNINGVYYHPTFFYESIWCLLGFVIVMLLRFKKSLKNGTQICFYMIWYGIGRFFIEGMRTDSLMLGSFKIAQIVSALAVLIAVVGLMLIDRRSKLDSLYKNDIKTKIRY